MDGGREHEAVLAISSVGKGERSSVSHGSDDGRRTAPRSEPVSETDT